MGFLTRIICSTATLAVDKQLAFADNATGAGLSELVVTVLAAEIAAGSAVGDPCASFKCVQKSDHG